MAELHFEPLELVRYPDRIAALIRERILSAGVRPGDRLPTEKELTDELGVSRSVVREALRLLEAGGLVDAKQGRHGGLFVSHGFHKPWRESVRGLLNAGRVDLDQVFEMRLLTEPYAARSVCVRADGEELEGLARTMEDSRNHLRDPERLRRNNLEFHVRLGELSGNPILALTIRANIEILAELVFNRLDLDLEHHFLEVHRGILGALLARDARAAEERTRRDIEEVKDGLARLRL